MCSKVKSPNLGHFTFLTIFLGCSSAVFIRCAERSLPPLLMQVSTSQHRLLSSSIFLYIPCIQQYLFTFSSSIQYLLHSNINITAAECVTVLL